MSQKKKSRPGKTLLVRLNGSEYDETYFSDLVGLETKSEVKNNSNFFLTFDTPENALEGLKKLKRGGKYSVSFSYYKLFFRLNGLKDDSNYSEIKSFLNNYVSTHTNSNMLYCKLYRKDNQYVGCGDMVLDTHEGMLVLLKNEELKNFTFGELSGEFRKYNNKRQVE